MAYRIGVDVGGTFTDFVLSNGSDARIFKVLSTPDDPSEAVFTGFQEMADAEKLPLEQFLGQVDRIIHGTTVTTNAVLTGNIATTGLLATRGFRDALEMRRGIREELYNNKFVAPAPPVPRWRRHPVTERIDHAGAVVTELELEDVDAAVAALEEAGVEAVAICFMHAYANPAHETAAADRLRQLMPDAYISVSSEILPQVRFYERTSTTTLNAAVGPILNRYLDRLVQRVEKTGFQGVLLIMQSNGGVTSPAVAARRAATTLLSGPAAGPVAGIGYAAAQNSDSFITIDMGGTSFEASMVQGGSLGVTTDAQVNRFAMALPSMDIKTIGAGGGSIAWIDDGGLLRMGPQSAGAKPGPVCYGMGGEEPTCSDANLILGYLSADYFAGGQMKLGREAAAAAIDTYVGGPLGLDTVKAASGMYRVMNVNMASAIREISVERGHDPRDFLLICAGGAGAIHAAMIARELGITKILVPREASVFCAAGMLHTDLKHDYVRSYATAFTADGVDQGHLLTLLKQMETSANDTLAGEGVAPADRIFRYALDLRYLGQYHEVRVEDVPEADIKEMNLEALRQLFHGLHDRLYGYNLAAEDTLVELVNVRLTAIGQTEKPALSETPMSGADAATAQKGQRPIWFPDVQNFHDVPVFDGDALTNGNQLNGPAIVETAVTTIFVPPDFELSVDKLGSCLLTDKTGETDRGLAA
jgi:N-methylhydantoinase A